MEQNCQFYHVLQSFNVFLGHARLISCGWYLQVQSLAKLRLFPNGQNNNFPISSFYIGTTIICLQNTSFATKKKSIKIRHPKCILQTPWYGYFYGDHHILTIYECDSKYFPTLVCQFSHTESNSRVISKKV